MDGIDQGLFSVTETGRGRICRGPLEVLSALVQNVDANTSLKFEVVRTLEMLRDHLEIREERGLEYVFAQALFIACVKPLPEGDALHEWLIEKFRSFDRRSLHITVMAKRVPLGLREPQLQRLRLLATKNVELIRAFHLARAIDADGPTTRSPEKEMIMLLLIKFMTGFDTSFIRRAA